MTWVRATDLAVLQRNGGIKKVRQALVLLEGDRLWAIANECPHQGAELTAGYVQSGWIECPLHSWRFDLRTGARINALSRDCIAVYPTRVVDGVVEVDLPE